MCCESVQLGERNMPQAGLVRNGIVPLLRLVDPLPRRARIPARQVFTSGEDRLGQAMLWRSGMVALPLCEFECN